MKKGPLISIIIVSYKNYRFIYKAIDSVLQQNYTNIEIIISNDGSDDFKSNLVSKYIEKNRRENIKNFVVNNNKKNLGTVKNINIAIRLSKGDYILMFAADDVIYNNKIVTKFVKAFQSLPKKELIVTSQVGMYDYKLKKLTELFVSKENERLIITLSPKELFGELSTRCIVPGCGTCYKRKIFKLHGYFDERYLLVEDYSSSLKYSRLGIKFNYFDFISFKHRDGGISHGNTIGDYSTTKKYDLDILNILKNEVYPYLNLLNEKNKKRFLKMYKNYKWRYSYIYEYLQVSKNQRRFFVVKNLKQIALIFTKDLTKDIINQFKGKKSIIFAFGIFLFTAYSLNIDYHKGINSLPLFNIASNAINGLNQTIGIIGIFIIVFAIVFTLFQFLLKYFIKIIKFIRFIF